MIFGLDGSEAATEAAAEAFFVWEADCEDSCKGARLDATAGEADVWAAGADEGDDSVGDDADDDEEASFALSA